MEDLGVIAVQLALNFPEWVRRRRFVVSYINDTTIQQRMSIDFVLPRETWFWSTVAPTAGSRIYVPLYLPAKETLDQFTAFDEDGRHLTMLPTADNGALAVAGLLPLVRGLARERLDPSRLGAVLPLLEAELTKVVMAPQRPDAPTTDAVLEAALRGPLGEVLTEDDQTKAVVQDLAGGFLMLVPVEYQPGVDRLLKAEWNVRTTGSASAAPTGRCAGRRASSPRSAGPTSGRTFRTSRSGGRGAPMSRLSRRRTSR
jgi:hypothetical protein